MVKKGSKTRRASLVTPNAEPDNITIADGTDHSKFSVIRSNTVVQKVVQPWSELKKECTNNEEIRDKVRRLLLDNVLPLLQELLTQFDVQQARDTELTEWIKTVLLIHTAYFMTLPEVVQRLSTLYKALDDRLTVYPKLLAMHGRLDLIHHQIDARSRKEDTDDESDAQAFSESDDEDDNDEDNEDEDDSDDEDDLMDMDDNEEVRKWLIN